MARESRYKGIIWNARISRWSLFGLMSIFFWAFFLGIGAQFSRSIECLVYHRDGALGISAFHVPLDFVPCSIEEFNPHLNYWGSLGALLLGQFLTVIAARYIGKLRGIDYGVFWKEIVIMLFVVALITY